ncbi:MAG: hypothetical protein HYT29_00165 [Parcubacteria group bacterium]|nr:hypothetical protein [Parcubacteria group bacterium]
MDFWRKFALACERKGINLRTYDFWSKEKSQPDDVLLVQNHPGETLLWRIFYFLKNLRSRGGFILARRKFLFENYKFFRHRALWQGESPMVVPYIYNNLENLKKSGIYHGAFFLSRRGGDYGYFNYFEYRDDGIVSPNFDDPKERFLVMVNTNAMPHSLVNEFYGERLKAIKYFSGVPGFDLYGYGWDKMPRHPFYFHYGKYVKKVFRGTAADKVKTLSSYKFTLCFENCAYPGYVSEKIFDCLAAGSIPVYLGAQDITSFVPENCFIDFRKFGSYKELHNFLFSRTEEDLANCRKSVRDFLENNSSRKPLNSFIDEVVGS